MKRYADRPVMKRNTLMRTLQKLGYPEEKRKEMVKQIMEHKAGSVEALKIIHMAQTRANAAQHLVIHRKRARASVQQHRRP
jgi:Holliday junction resolvasome RuvABC DNA-binding subunit